jgi:RNA polymerase sigma-70 factor (ECF subfamily)
VGSGVERGRRVYCCSGLEPHFLGNFGLGSLVRTLTGTGMVFGRGPDETTEDGDQAEDLVYVERVLREGTLEAFRPLYERYKDKVYNTAYRITGDASLAEDVAHDVFLLVYERLGQFRRKSRFSSWLYRVTVNRATDVVRRRRRERWLFAARVGEDAEEGEVAATVEERTPEGAVESAELAEGVARALGELSLKLRTVVVLRYFEGLRYEEIAEVIGRSVGTVKSRLSRAHGKLWPELEKFL